MRKTAILAAALAVVLSTVAMSSASAQELSTTKSEDFVGKVLLASSEQTSDADKQSEQKPAENAEAKPAETAPQPVIVTVQAGDSLSSIATAHSTTWNRLYDANTAIADPNLINPGQQIRIPDAAEQIPARALPQPVVVAPAVTTQATSTRRAATAAPASYPVSPNAAKAFIYAHESGNNPNATNPNGCYGLGQDCNGRVRSLCGADYACQDAFFTRYAMSRYGSWEAAYAFWQSHRWW